MTYEHANKWHNRAISAIALVILAYVVLLFVGLPQRATDSIVANLHDHGAVESQHVRDATPPDANHIEREMPPPPPYWMLIPFALLLSGIALLPLIPITAHWWESNRNRFLVAVSLAATVLAYYALLHRTPFDAHWPTHHTVRPSGGSVQFGFAAAVLADSLLQEYVPFIVLLFSLYTISGGIRITGDLPASPAINTAFLATGALLASFIGTTGAGMLLIRPLLETNRERKHVAHTVVLFIFTVCNCGGCLLPLGDPPLFLGYLQGVPFLWTFGLWREWLFVNGLLLFIYFLMDTLWFHRRESLGDIARDVQRHHRLRIAGWKINAPLLLGVVFAIALLDSSKPVAGTHWHAWLYLREIVQLALVAVSLTFGSRQARESNSFNYHAIIEVAAIFTGIFITMQPALQILKVHGPELGVRTPTHYFWATGILSSVLDNAPTYLVFFQTAQAMPSSANINTVAGVEPITLIGISLGAVFMGAMTYIGNGPNFMVRAIAEQAGVKMPSFFGYLLYSVIILLPVLALMLWSGILFPYGK